VTIEFCHLEAVSLELLQYLCFVLVDTNFIFTDESEIDQDVVYNLAFFFHIRVKLSDFEANGFKLMDYGYPILKQLSKVSHSLVAGNLM
jgi:hypothetical protein